MRLARERLAECRADMERLLPAHHAEVGVRGSKLLPNWAHYEALESQRMLWIYTARGEAGELLGYAAFVLCWHAHDASLLVAHNEATYLAPGARAGWAGYRLLKFADRKLAEAGVDRVFWHVKFTRDFRPLLERLGYEAEEVVMAKINRRES